MTVTKSSFIELEKMKWEGEKAETLTAYSLIGCFAHEGMKQFSK